MYADVMSDRQIANVLVPGTLVLYIELKHKQSQRIREDNKIVRQATYHDNI